MKVVFVSEMWDLCWMINGSNSFKKSFSTSDTLFHHSFRETYSYLFPGNDMTVGWHGDSHFQPHIVQVPGSIAWLTKGFPHTIQRHAD